MFSKDKLILLKNKIKKAMKGRTRNYYPISPLNVDNYNFVSINMGNYNFASIDPKSTDSDYAIDSLESRLYVMQQQGTELEVVLRASQWNFDGDILTLKNVRTIFDGKYKPKLSFKSDEFIIKIYSFNGAKREIVKSVFVRIDYSQLTESFINIRVPSVICKIEKEIAYPS